MYKHRDRITCNSIVDLGLVLTALLICCILGLWSTSTAWGYSVKPAQATDHLATQERRPPPTPGSGAPTPGYTPCPPQHSCSNPQMRAHPKYRQRRRKQLHVRATLALSRLWLQPVAGKGISHLLVDMRFLYLSTEGFFNSSKYFTFGAAVAMLDIRMERWFQPREKAWGNISLRTIDLGPSMFRLGGRHWYFDTMIVAFRTTSITLPRPVLTRLWQSAKFKGAAPTEFAVDEPSLLNIGGRFGLRLGYVSLDASIALLDASLNSYRAVGRAHFRSHGIFVALETIFQQEQRQMELKAGKDHLESGAIVGALWQRATWDTQLLVELDLLRLASRKKRKIPVSLHALFGVRYRYNLDHQLTDAEGARLFEEPVGGQWSFNLGLRIALGR